jgi:hypothetical protein
MKAAVHGRSPSPICLRVFSEDRPGKQGGLRDDRLNVLSNLVSGDPVRFGRRCLLARQDHGIDHQLADLDSSPLLPVEVVEERALRRLDHRVGLRGLLIIQPRAT